MSAKADLYPNKNFGFRLKSRPVVAFGVKSKIFILFGGAGGRVPLGGGFLPARLCRATARSDCSEIGCPRSAGIDRRHRPDLTSGTFLVPLLVTKEERPAADAVFRPPPVISLRRRCTPPTFPARQKTPHPAARPAPPASRGQRRTRFNRASRHGQCPRCCGKNTTPCCDFPPCRPEPHGPGRERWRGSASQRQTCS